MVSSRLARGCVPGWLRSDSVPDRVHAPAGRPTRLRTRAFQHGPAAIVTHDPVWSPRVGADPSPRRARERWRTGIGPRSWAIDGQLELNGPRTTNRRPARERPFEDIMVVEQIVDEYR